MHRRNFSSAAAMLISSFLLSVTLPLVFAQDIVFNCAEFWPSVKPGERNTVNAQCRLYPGYPLTIGQTTVTVIYTDDWKAEIGIIDALLNEAIVQSIALYSTLTPPPNMVIILGMVDNPNAAMSAGMPTFPDGPCQIRGFKSWGTSEAIIQSPGAMQVIAHEIYHCVQTMMLGPPPDSPVRWVIESSADYFSNLVFPQANREWDDSINYSPDIPIWEQKYKPELFFQALEPSRGMVYLHQFVMSTIYTNTAEEERARLASIPGFADDFWLFAQDFSLIRIRDTGGGIVPIQNPPERRNMIWSVNEDETEGTSVLEVMPFTIAQFTTEFDPGQTVRVTSSAKGNQRIAWRLSGQAHWTDLAGGGSTAVITIPCAGEPQAVRFLITSTEDKAADKLEVKFVQTYKDENCCKKKGKRDTKECPTKSVSVEPPEPTSTGSGTCAGSDIVMDPCLTGHKWSLDIPSTRELMRKNLGGIPDVTINDVQVGGSGTLSVGSDDIHFTYTSLKVDVDLTASGLSLPVSVTIDGQASGYFVITSGGSGSGKACLAFKSGKGTARAVLPFIGEEVFDLAPGGGYLIDMDVDYTCNDGRMTIASTAAQAPGAPSWGPFAYNAV